VTVSLVTGAGGFVGRHLSRTLAARGHEVRPVSRSARQHPGPYVSVLETDESALTRALGGVDNVYFLAGMAHRPLTAADAGPLHALNVAAPLRWLEAADRAGVRRFVWLSSIKVLGDTSTRPLTAQDPYAPADAYARSKAAAEQALLGSPRSALALAVVRPPLVYGPGVGGNFAALLRWAAGPAPLPLGCATAPRSLVSVGNLCDLLGRLSEDGSGVYHVADDEDVHVAKLLGEVRRLLGRPPRLLAVPRPIMRAAAQVAGRLGVYERLFEPLQVDSAATCQALAWQPPQSRAEALEETVAWLPTSR